MNRGFEPVSLTHKKNEEQVLIPLPLRGTKTSAGYDFYTPIDLVIKPQQKLLMWTDVKAKMPEGEVLILVVRSSMGTKNDLMLANTIGVVDSDYFGNEGNDGNIGISLRNLKPNMEIENYAYTHIPMHTSKEVVDEENGTTDYELANYDEVRENKAKLVTMDFPIPIIKDLLEENTVEIKAGERVAQGIFVKFEESENCNSDGDRKGGFGSTSEQK